MLEVSVTPEHTRDAFVDELTEKFAVVQDRLIFVSLIYPSVRLSYQVNIHADLFHFFQRVLRKVPKRSWRDPQLKRLFVIEENDEAGLHCHFMFEIPTGITRDELIEVCREQWVKIALRDRKRSEHWKRLNCGARISLAEKRTILIKKKDTAGAPASGDLTNAAGGAEIAVNTATKRIYSKDSGGTVIEMGTYPSSMAVQGDLSSTGNTTLGNASSDTLTVNALVNSNLLFTDATYDIGASGATRPRDMFLSRNLTVGGTLTLAGGVNLNGNVTIGDSSADTLTINSTITSNLIFTDNTYDIGGIMSKKRSENNCLPHRSLNLDDKYVTNIKCNLWYKQDDINDFLRWYKNGGIKTISELISLDDMYQDYKVYFKAKGTIDQKNYPIVSKQYFEKFVIKTIFIFLCAMFCVFKFAPCTRISIFKRNSSLDRC